MSCSQFIELLDESKAIHTSLNIGSLPPVVRRLLNDIEGEIAHYERWYQGELTKIKLSFKSFDDTREPLAFLFYYHPSLFENLQKLYVKCTDANVLYQFFSRQDTDHIILIIGEWHAQNIEKILDQYQVYNATKVGEYEYNVSDSYF